MASTPPAIQASSTASRAVWREAVGECGGAPAVMAPRRRSGRGLGEEGARQLDGDDVLAGHGAAPGEVRAVAVARPHGPPAAAAAAHLVAPVAERLDGARVDQAARPLH